MSEKEIFDRDDLVIWKDDFYHKEDEGDLCRVLYGNKDGQDLIMIDPQDLRIGSRWVPLRDVRRAP